MRKIFLFLLFFLPCFVYADIAGPVLTKDQACLGADGASMNRLQVFLNGKKSDILYFFKENTSLYYVVPMFPNIVTSQGITTTYNAALFLYRYDCTYKKSYLLSSQNLKKLLSKSTVFTPATPFNATMTKEFNYGQVVGVRNSNIFFLIGITQTGISGAYSYDLKNMKFENQIFIDNNWNLKNYKTYNGVYDNEGDWRGVDVYYNDKKIFHFAGCKGWGTRRQSDVDDFCGANINIISSSNTGLLMKILYNYPGSPLESGNYLLGTNGLINKVTK
ncbi:MAG: hypothetical protein HHAS10_05650 [Candidatus Altimarinota bacterium]